MELKYVFIHGTAGWGATILVTGTVKKLLKELNKSVTATGACNGNAISLAKLN